MCPLSTISSISLALRSWLILMIIAFFLAAATSTANVNARKLASPISESANLNFIDGTSQANLNISHQTLTPFGLNMMISGAAAGDFNQDGWVDLFVLGGGGITDTLHINNGDGTFRDEADSWGLAQKHRGSGAAVGDINGDGWPDIFVTSHGITTTATIGQHRLYRNNGDGSFTDIARTAGVNKSNSERADGFGSVFGDYDLDGDLDLYVTGWHDGEQGNRLYRNNNDETFTDVTEDAGLETTNLRGFSPCFADMDGDGFPELLVTADFDTTKYYVNNGDGTFSERTKSAQVNKPAFGMGSTINDLNNDGLLDWYLTSIYDENRPSDGNRFYINEGSHRFTEVAQAAGVDNGYWGWGTASVDLDHDGWLDLVETNGWTGEPGFASFPNRVWLNNTDNTFREVADSVNFSHPMEGRSLLHFDYDNDGDQDILITTNNGSLHLYTNELNENQQDPEESPPTTHWLKVQLDTVHRTDLAPEGFGARITIATDSLNQTRFVNGCPSYLSQNETTIHFGLGEANIVDKLVVTWPDGSQSRLTGLTADRTLTIRAPFKTVLPVMISR